LGGAAAVQQHVRQLVQGDMRLVVVCRPFPPASSTAHLNTLGGLATTG
jgi:hypothetical protein